MVTPEEVMGRLREINVWRRGDERAVNKPLLLLFALGKASRKEKRLISYAEIDEKLRELLQDFGPQRSAYHPEYPFWRLQGDNLWDVTNKEKLRSRVSNTDIPKSELLKNSVEGGFPDDIFSLLQSDHELICKAANQVLESHFPSSIHEDILSSVGLAFTERQGFSRAKRSSSFRDRVLRAYEYRCAICGFDLRIGNGSLALEAAHIKWHQAGGLDDENNGLALCVMHHKVFDRGAISISEDRKVIVS